MHWVILFLILPCLVATVHFKGCLRETLFVEKCKEKKGKETEKKGKAMSP